LGLIGRRLFDPNLRNYSSGGTLFNLFFLLALFGSGIIALFTVKDFYGEMMQYAKTLFFADTSGSISGIISLHCVITLLFLAYLPYTKMLHFLAKYFTYHEVRWNDKPMIADGRMEEDVKKLLSQPVTWAAPHLNADGKKNWVDIVSEEKKNEK
jgi:nitrate reductase gamma subunit